MDAVAAFVVGIVARLGSPNTVELNEEDDGTFHDAQRVRSTERLRIVDGQLNRAHMADGLERDAARRPARNIVLRPDHFLLRPTGVAPARGAKFLDGVVRRTDRSPHAVGAAADAAFGWSRPKDTGPDRIAVTVCGDRAGARRPLRGRR